ncbi:hypothetical protein FGO68_gene14094 [Halteria grandinella]|uniref:Uncharacterized protein n=1 Tax=Halteria grandinella TaxID=5974 RepID=A0A8J8NY01_HALGN|nr:hypothetical protein FGO68_gene14094 [Halteria grandinella]
MLTSDGGPRQILAEINKSDLMNVWLPMGVIIIGCTLLMTCKEFLTLVDRKYFLKPFLAKTIICILVIPVLWKGQNETNGQDIIMVLGQTTSLYGLYSYFIWWTSGVILALQIANGVLQMMQSHYISRHDQSHYIQYYYTLKKMKFEAFFIFSINLLPIFILLNGRDNLPRLLGLGFNLGGLIYLECHYQLCSLHTLFSIAIILINMITHISITEHAQKYTCPYILSLGEISPSYQVFLGFLKANCTNFITFSAFALYTQFTSHLCLIKYELKQAMKHERHYESQEDIVRQVYLNDLMFKLGAFMIGQGGVDELVSRTYLLKEVFPTYKMPIFMTHAFQLTLSLFILVI